jgi:hypothetical protein
MSEELSDEKTTNAPLQQGEQRRREQAEHLVRRMMGLHLQENAIIALDWWLVTAAFEMIANKLPPYPDIFSMGTSVERELKHIRYSAIADSPDGSYVSVGIITFRLKGNSTEVETRSDSEEFISYWRNILEALSAFVAATTRIRQAYELTADDVVERYYRSRAAGSRTTIKQLAEQYGFSYESLKKHKQRYDAAGKWGSRKGQFPSK